MDLDLPVHSSGWPLRTLSADSIRIIFEYLGYSELLALYATLDRHAQKLITTPGIIYQLTPPHPKKIRTEYEHTFLHSIRDITRLEFGQSHQTDPKSLRLLLALNPRILVLNALTSLDTIAKSLIKLEGSPKDRDALRNTQHVTINGFPDLARLTPRLESLICYRSLDKDYGWPWQVYSAQQIRNNETWHQLSLPPTLTSLHIPNGINKQFALSLPPTIVSLELLPCNSLAGVSLPDLFARVPHLESLELFSHNSYAPVPLDDLVFPNSLTNLAVAPSLLVGSLIPQLKRSRIKSLSVHRGLGYSDIAPNGLRSAMPTSLNSLYWEPSIDSPGSSHLSPLPATITVLNLRLSASTRKDFFDCLNDLQPLKTLKIDASMMDFAFILPALDGGKERSASTSQLNSDRSKGKVTIRLDLLPKSITDLQLHDRGIMLTLPGVENLPPNLERLSMTLFPLEHVQTLRTRSSKCQLSIIAPIALLNTINGQWLQAKFLKETPNSWDWTMFSSAIIRHFAPFNVSFTLTSFMAESKTSEAKTMNINSFTQTRFTDSGSIRLSPTLDKNLFLPMRRLTDLKLDFPAVIDVLPNTLTRMDLGFALQSFLDLPTTLTHLSASSTAECTRFTHNGPPNLTYLNAPNWSFAASYIQSAVTSDCQLLKCTVGRLPDYQVIDFLTKAPLTYKTRLIAELSLEVSATGALVPDDGDMTIITRETISQFTIAALKRELELPMPSTDGPSALSADTIGCVVKSIQCKGYGRDATFSIPHSAVAVKIEYEFNWKLSPYLLKHGLHPDGVESLPRSIFAPHFHVMARLELLNVIDAKDWWSELPPTLRYLHVQTRQSLASIGNFVPPLLETFILKTGGIKQERRHFIIAELLPFSFLELPASLVHLVILADSFCLSNLAVECESRVKLPRLKSVLLEHATDVTMDSLCSMLPLRQLERFEVANMVQTLASRRAVPPELGTPAQLKKVAGGAHVEKKSNQKLKLLGSIDYSAISAPPIESIEPETFMALTPSIESQASIAAETQASMPMKTSSADEEPPKTRRRAVRKPRK